MYMQYGVCYMPLALESIVRVYSAYPRSGAVYCIYSVIIVCSWLRNWIRYIQFHSEECFSGKKHESACELSYTRRRLAKLWC